MIHGHIINIHGIWSYETREQTSAAPRLRRNIPKFSRLQATLCAFFPQYKLLSNTYA